MSEVVSFGCRLNITEGAAIGAMLPDNRNQIVINTCAVTAEAERQARQAIRKARKTHPDAEIIVTGCAAQINPQAFRAMPEVGRVIGNVEKMDPGSYTRDDPVILSDILQVRQSASHLAQAFDGRTRAFVEIQQGCNHRCTFCIIPYGRGNARSIPAGRLVQHIGALVADGYREVVLTGVDITSYGEDLPGKPTLVGLIARILRLVPGLPRLRLSSIDPAEVGDEFFQLFAEQPRLMPHLHISMQAGEDMILKRMKRRHLRADLVRFCAQARQARPDVVLGADIIAGFPTETDAQFVTTAETVAACGLTYLHVFPYSPRPGTPAAKMPQVDKAVRKQRAAQLRAMGEAAKARFYQSLIGTPVEVIVETDGVGRTPHFAPIHLEQAGVCGTLCTVIPETYRDGVLYGRGV